MSLLLSLDGQKRNIKKPAVLHIVPNGDLASGGLAYASIRLAHEQAREGVDVYVIEVDSSKHRKSSWWCDKVIYLNFKKDQSIIKKFANLWKFIANRHIVMHFHGVWYPQYISYFFLAFITNSPIIISPHGNLEPSALRQKFLKKYLARKLYFNRIVSHARVLWACSEKERSNLQREFHKVDVDIVPIGVDVPQIFLSGRIGRSNENYKKILVVSRLNPGKGLLNLVHAWKLIQDENWHIIIAGPDENNFQRKLEDEVKKLNLTRFFTFTGYVDAVQRDALYRQADIFILPSLSENFGIVVAEAMSYGIPVITTNETPWASVGLERGCLCVGTSPENLSCALMHIISLPEDVRLKIGTAGRLFITNNFSWDKIAEYSRNQVKNLLKHGPSKSYDRTL
jgi:glycosyltransferase involved in cell wall biosynthesis